MAEPRLDWLTGRYVEYPSRRDLILQGFLPYLYRYKRHVFFDWLPSPSLVDEWDRFIDPPKGFYSLRRVAEILGISDIELEERLNITHSWKDGSESI